MGKKIILLAEDDKDIAEMYEIAFNKAGFKTVLACNGEEVLERAKKISFDILLLDINMPNKVGFEVLKDISENLEFYEIFKEIPILMLSNYNNPQDINYCMKMGAQDYIIKSEWPIDHIIKRIKENLEEE